MGLDFLWFEEVGSGGSARLRTGGGYWKYVFRDARIQGFSSPTLGWIREKKNFGLNWATRNNEESSLRKILFPSKKLKKSYLMPKNWFDGMWENGATRGIFHNKMHIAQSDGGVRTPTPTAVSRVHVGLASSWMSSTSRKRRDTETRQKKARRKMQHLIYFWNIQIKIFQHAHEDTWNTWNMRPKHL